MNYKLWGASLERLFVREPLLRMEKPFAIVRNLWENSSFKFGKLRDFGKTQLRGSRGVTYATIRKLRRAGGHVRLCRGVRGPIFVALILAIFVDVVAG